MYKSKYNEKMFWSRVDVTDPEVCWEWQSTKAHTGYGVITIRYKLNLAHRLAWEYANGPIPEGMCVCHKCDNPPCCNPAHLFLGSHTDNLRDASKKGRMPRGEESHFAKLSEKDIETIREMAQKGTYQREIAAQFGVSRTGISAIVNGYNWNHVPTETETVDRSHGSDHPLAKLTPDRVREIRTIRKTGISQKRTADLFGVSRGTIDAIDRGLTWKDVK